MCIENGLVIPADQASAGVRLIIFFVALAYHPQPPKLVLIEEPENGVHPKRLEEIMNLIRKLSKGEYGGYPVQVIISTHSPYLLDFIDLDNDQILVFKREENGDRTIAPVNKEKLKVFLDEFMLGEIWFNEGEEKNEYFG